LGYPVWGNSRAGYPSSHALGDKRVIYGFLLAVGLFLASFAACIFWAKREHAKWVEFGKSHDNFFPQ